jgi:hypothetical protein
MADFTEAQRLKFQALAGGIRISNDASVHLAQANRHRPLTPADYASTTGVILLLEDDVWVNAPVSEYNPNFVENPLLTLGMEGPNVILQGGGLASRARVWLPPEYHGELAPNGQSWNYFVITHGDRARLAPIGGCAMACKFCNIPYEDPYQVKPLELLVEATRRALEDSLQPARHVLISGGTPKLEDVHYLSDVYATILQRFPEVEIDIMMAPVEGVLNLPQLRDLGIHELSINLEVFDRQRARTLMPHKYRQGLEHYLRFIEQAASVLGPGRVRSMLMVGLEEPEMTLEGVKAIVDAGAVPVLSPFRPDPSTPLRDISPLGALEAELIFCEATQIVEAAGTRLGPDCPPCTHNTLTLVDPSKTSPLGQESSLTLCP